jgi:uncharacterized protein YfaS (alpha-2-macroglobulin family)
MFSFFKGCILVVTIFLTSAAHAQTIKNYTAEWKNVEALIEKKLPKSALTEVKKIYTLAKKDKQEAQLIKSLIYITGLQEETREDNEVLAINEMEKEIAGSSEAAAAILNSLTAGLYFNFYENHRWELYDRTNTVVSFKKEDIKTWSTDDFHKKISALYLRSLQDEQLLKQTRLDKYNAIIIEGNVRHLRPTLFDLLAHRALDYFKSDESYITKPAYKFEIDQASAFDPAADFITRKFTTKDSLSLQHKALLIYQKLIAFHLNDAKHDALIDADIKRLEFVSENSTHPDKEKLFRQSLNHIANQYNNLPAAAQAWYLLANAYNADANTYKAYGDSTHRLDRLKAKEICERVLKQKDSSEGKINCLNLLSQITRKELQFKVEKVNVPAMAFRSLVEYRNLNEMHLRIIRSDEKLKKELENQDNDKYWTALLKAIPVKAWQQVLPATSDMQEHKVEIKIDPLMPGEYILISSSDKDFKVDKSVLGARLFYISNISYVNSGKDYFVLHRETGQPLPNAAIQIWEQRYDQKQSKYVIEKSGSYKADANGYFKIKEAAKKDNYNFTYQLDISYKDERFYMNEWLYDYYYSNTETEKNESTSIFLFTDRSIYRPGQTLYYKGITILRSAKKGNSIWPNYKTTVYLEDANGEVVDSMKVTTNEYGSFSGKFQLPASGLNGNFSLSTENEVGTISFKVEEYKRPKFYVDYEPLKGTYKVNDLIKVTGFAKAYAGNNIDGASVKYRVVRQPRFLYPWISRKWWMPPSEEMEIKHGETKTDKDGKFVVEFEAIPDLKIDKKFDPVFDYTVYADITDITGETRSGENSVSVSYKSLMLKTDIPELLPVDSLKLLKIYTENMNGEHEPAKVTVTISKLKEEKRLIRDRYWERPDQFLITKNEYILNFPHDEFDNETEWKLWEKEKQVFTGNDSTHASGEWRVASGKFEPGFYQIEISTKDKNGEDVKDVQFIELYDESSNQLNKPEYLWTDTKNEAPEPGEKTTVKLGTTADDLFIVQELDKNSGAWNLPVGKPGSETGVKYSFIKLNNEKKNLEYPATEADRGGFGISYLFVKHNRFHSVNQTVRVPWSNKELKIEYATFRDKTLPGSEEKWKIKISGYKNEKIAAEMLASMYDASLDEFTPHWWSEPSMWPSYANYYRRWDGTRNFSQIESQQRWIAYEDSFVYKLYDELVTDYENANTTINKVPFLRTVRRGDWKSVGNMTYAAAPPDANAVYGFSASSLKTKDQVGYLNVLGERAKKADTTAFNVFDPLAKDIKLKSEPVQPRRHFNETAFFLPDLRTNENGDIEFSFTMPEALTKWKFQALAHTKDLAFGYSSKEIVTQKDLMVQPNPPRFLREGDKIELSAKIVNLTDKEITGQTQLQLFDAATNEPVDGLFRSSIPNQYFTVAAGQSEAVKFPLEIPYQFNKALVWRIVAKSGDKSDGEENALPVLTNRMLVTESMPINMKGVGTKDFKFEKLLNSGSSSSLQHHAVTVEYTTNPVWYAVQALPYLMEYPYECAEQIWNRYYANALATMIANSSPRIKQIFETWSAGTPSEKIKDTAALMSNLQKNQELKAVLLEETPWVLQAKNEEQQKKNIALLFDLIRMSKEMNSTYEKLKQMQSSNGGFVWFNGGPDNAYITQYIITGIGHLKKLGVDIKKLKPITDAAIAYLDNQIKNRYDDLKKSKTDLNKYTPGTYELQYLYMRSFFPEIKIGNASKTAYDYFRGRSQKTWTQQSKYMQGMIALFLHRTNDLTIPAAILKSLKETSIINEELGMYWKEQTNAGYYWYQAPVETQALLIEAFNEAGKDIKSVDDLKTWLLKNKQTTNWKTTKATAEACYALLLQGTKWQDNETIVEIKLGNSTFKSTDTKTESGTGYFKKTIDGNMVEPEMGNISVTIKPQSTNQPIIQSTSWGSVYWQYFEDLDKITTASTPLKLEKKLFIEKNTDRGPVLTPVNEGDYLKVGDKIKVRIELRADRDMEYVHMKDMRASCMEPVNVLSSYKWQGGLGYYETTKDASTNFFFDYVRKGTYVFEYALFVTHTGNFSNGVTTIQCMYAPEFTSHSEGVRVNVE